MGEGCEGGVEGGEVGVYCCEWVGEGVSLLFRPLCCCTLCVFLETEEREVFCMDGMRCAGWEVGRGRIRRGGIEEEGRLTVKIPRNVIILCTTRVILRPRRRARPVRSTRVDL